MYKAIVIRLLPTQSQAKLFWQNVGTARWTWNWGLALQKKSYSECKEILSVYELKREFTEVRNSEKFKWLQEVSRQVEANALIDLDKAYKNFFRRLRTGKTGGMPKFKSKGKCTPSFCTRSEKVKVDEQDRIYLEKIGWIRFKAKENLTGVKFYNARVKFENEKWLLKCAVEVLPEESKIILSDVNMGIDVGVKSLAVVSYGGHKRVFRNINRSHKMRRLTRQLKHHQRILSRKKKGSKNYLKEKYRVQDLYGRIRRRRHEYIKQTAAKIVSMKPKVIVLEDLNIQGMMKNRHLARAVAEQNLYLLRTLIERKAAASGIKVEFADRFYPSSKTCSNCGHVKKDLKLSERIYKCPECGKVIDRDFNAALNLERLA
ncbi:MAG: transposase [Synergistaceae bacterium]|nr:transposase [Synergistaceae bacterium]MBQ3398185.1 transposase [Synergistaceae bacterium]MBQ6115639.1 transposase [Synergistaceae bacterium]MBQ6664282.1 transposase [Synergistaceae bacterium]MBQ6981087.1 transposase [Synergistaceae bacterium]